MTDTDTEPTPAPASISACQTELAAELDALVEKQDTLQPGDYARRHMALTAAMRACEVLAAEYQEGTMEERPQPEPTPGEEPPPPPPPPDDDTP